MDPHTAASGPSTEVPALRFTTKRIIEPMHELEEAIDVTSSTQGVTDSGPRGPQLAHPHRERTIGELFAALSAQLSNLFRSEIQLAVAQATEKGKRIGVGAGLLAVAGLLGLYLLGVLIAAAILGLAVVLPAWAAALIVAGVLLVVILILALLGKKSIDASKKFAPAPQEGLKADLDALKKGVQ